MSTMRDMKTETLSSFRVSRGIPTQAALARAAGICLPTMNRIERRRIVPSQKTIEKLARALKTRPARIAAMVGASI